MAARLDIYGVLTMSVEKRKKELKDGIVQLVKYNIVGVINTLVDFLVYQLLTYLGMKYAIAQCISYSCGILNSYFFNSRWTFRRDSGRSKKEFIYFVAVNLVSMGLSVLLLKVCYEILNINSNLISKAIVTPIVMLVNFFGSKLFVFKK